VTTPAAPSGIYSAQWIPTDEHGRVQRESLAAHIDFERRAGISGLLALGSTGEFPFFTLAERRDVLTTVAELAAPLSVIANISDIRPRDAIELGLHAKSLGIATVALMPPMFYPVSPADLLEYFLHVADAVGLPVMLYNFPELAGKRIDLETVAAFADRAPMIAFKQSGGEFEYHRELIALGREKAFAVMSGADTRLPDAFALGASGAIGGLVNIVPELMVDLFRAHGRGESGHGRDAAASMKEIGRIMERLSFPLNVAAGLEARGFDPGAPKRVVSPESLALYGEIVSELKTLFDRLGLTLTP
jgi:4-hydroxy-tetrahydrodipicolinate synthase